MRAQIDELVKMRDIETLYELMAEDEDWMVQLDAAEGLVRLGDKRGLEFLLSAQKNEEAEIRDLAKEILNGPEVKRLFEDIRAEEKRGRREKVEIARTRLQKGKKVFRYKMVLLPIAELLDEDPTIEGFYVPGLIEFGLEGWEVVNLMPRRGQAFGSNADEYIPGAYFLLKREVMADESAELDGV